MNHRQFVAVALAIFSSLIPTKTKAQSIVTIKDDKIGYVELKYLAAKNKALGNSGLAKTMDLIENTFSGCESQMKKKLELGEVKETYNKVIFFAGYQSAEDTGSIDLRRFELYENGSTCSFFIRTTNNRFIEGPTHDCFNTEGQYFDLNPTTGCGGD